MVVWLTLLVCPAFHNILAAGTCSDIAIVPRGSGGTVNPKISFTPVLKTSFYVYIPAKPLFEDSPVCRKTHKAIVDAYNTTGRNLKYNFLIDEEGNIYEIGGWTTLCDRTNNDFKSSLAVSFIGGQRESLSKSALEAAKQLLHCGMFEDYLTPYHRIFWYRDTDTQDCRGNILYRVISISSWPKFDSSHVCADVIHPTMEP